MINRPYSVVVATFIALTATTAASAMCFINCPPSNSTVISDVVGRKFQPMGQVIRIQSAQFMDSQDAQIMGVSIYRAMLKAEFIFASGESVGTPQSVTVTYEKRNSGWALADINCKICF